MTMEMREMRDREMRDDRELNGPIIDLCVDGL